MNNPQIAKLKSWFDARNTRERVLVLLLGWAVIYMTWNLLMTRPLALQEKVLDSEIGSLSTQITTLKAKADSIFKVATDSTMNQKIVQQKSLVSQADTLKQRLDDLTKSLIKKDQLPQMLADISSYHEEINLLNLKYINREPLIPSNVDATGLPIYNKVLYRNNYEMHFEGGYFMAIKYLHYLESLPWRLYLDSLEYKTATYPTGDVTIRFHVITNQTD